MRLTLFEQEEIKESFRQNFGAEDHLWLFGSRVDDNKRGGDIDLYVETMESDTVHAVKKEIAFMTDLWVRIGEQKIDVVLNVLSSPYELPVYRIAKETGIQLV
jgi:predicted nucleotidyltransferase